MNMLNKRTQIPRLETNSLVVNACIPVPSFIEHLFKRMNFVQSGDGGFGSQTVQLSTRYCTYLDMLFIFYMEV